VLAGPVIKTAKKLITKPNCNQSHRTIGLSYSWYGSSPVIGYTKSCERTRPTKTGYNWFMTGWTVVQSQDRVFEGKTHYSWHHEAWVNFSSIVLPS
jgi:hypothetical protein